MPGSYEDAHVGTDSLHLHLAYLLVLIWLLKKKFIVYLFENHSWTKRERFCLLVCSSDDPNREAQPAKARSLIHVTSVGGRAPNPWTFFPDSQQDCRTNLAGVGVLARKSTAALFCLHFLGCCPRELSFRGHYQILRERRSPKRSLVNRGLILLIGSEFEIRTMPEADGLPVVVGGGRCQWSCISFRNMNDGPCPRLTSRHTGPGGCGHGPRCLPRLQCLRTCVLVKGDTGVERNSAWAQCRPVESHEQGRWPQCCSLPLGPPMGQRPGGVQVQPA